MRAPIKVFSMILLGWILSTPALAFDYQIQISEQNAVLPSPAVVNDPAYLADSVVAKGQGDIQRAWLSDATTRYQHGVFGIAVEAASITAQLRNGQRVKFTLPENSVFEDRRLRLVDMDGDGKQEIISMRTYLDKGAALVVLGLNNNLLEIVAEAPAIGLPMRWLNPVGVADFDGDGALEIAVVNTPHIGGTLKLYQLSGDQLAEKYALYGFSNHANKSLPQQLSAIMDLDGDDQPEILLPNAGRSSLEIVTVKKGALKTVASIPVENEITGPFRVNGKTLSMPLVNGQLLAITFNSH